MRFKRLRVVLASMLIVFALFVGSIISIGIFANSGMQSSFLAFPQKSGIAGIAQQGSTLSTTPTDAAIAPLSAQQSQQASQQVPAPVQQQVVHTTMTRAS